MRRLARLFAETIITYRNRDLKTRDQVPSEELLVDVDELLRGKPSSKDDILHIKEKLPFTDRYRRNECESIKDFVLAMLIGVISGSYSSIFTATPVLVLWEDWVLKRKRTKK